MNRVQYYNHIALGLEYPQSIKIARFLAGGCIFGDGDTWFCSPIEGYNTRTYMIKKSLKYRIGWECGCQGFQDKAKRSRKTPYCSHVHALLIFLD